MVNDSRSRAPRGLTREEVVNAAVEELDTVGIARFSARGVARRLGVYPTAVHWHLGRQGQLLSRLVDAVLEGVPDRAVRDAEGDGPRRALTRIAHEYRDAVAAHPQAAPLLASQARGAQSTGRIMQALAGHLRAWGFQDQQLRAAANLVMSAIVGFTAMEFSPTHPPGEDGAAVSGDGDGAVIDLTGEVRLDDDVAAALEGQAFGLRPRDVTVLDEAFEECLEVLLDGLEAMLARPARD